MANVQKYFVILENLKDYNKSDNITQYFQSNIHQIQRQLGHLTTTSNEPHLSWQFVKLLNFLISEIATNVNLEVNATENVINLRQFELLLQNINRLAHYGLSGHLSEAFRKNLCFQNHFKEIETFSTEERVVCLGEVIEVFAKLFQHRQLVQNQKLEFCLLEFMAAIYSAIEIKPSDNFVRVLDTIYSNVEEQYFKNLLILKSVQECSKDVKQALHMDLMKRLVAKNGFKNLCKNLLRIEETDSTQPMWKRSEVVFNIVAHKGHSKDFHLNIIVEICRFLEECRQVQAIQAYSSTCVGSLMRIHSLQEAEVCDKIERFVFDDLDKFITPADLLTGTILFDHNELTEIIDTLHLIFCGSFGVCFKTKILVPYFRILFNLYSQFEQTHLMKSQLSTLIVKTLQNRDRTELNEILNIVLRENHSSLMYKMHPRIALKCNNQILSCQIVADNDRHYYDPAQCLVEILRQSQHNILIYKIFVNLLEQLAGEIDTQKSNGEFLDDASELAAAMELAFKTPLRIVTVLTELIEIKEFHSQFNENPQEILSIISEILKKQLTKSSPTENSNFLIILILSIVREFVRKLKSKPDFLLDFLRLLEKYDKSCQNDEIKMQIKHLFELINPNPDAATSCSPETSKFEMAKRLCEERAPHLRVYGIMEMIKLIEVDRCEEAIANKHSILAISIILLRDEDSYTFLNCIKLMVALARHVMEIEVLDALVAEYQKDESDVDFRLKVGEVIVKVTEMMGPISYKYKESLINCFLRGCTMDNNELRTSNLANLGTICRILTYQVHQFFQELILIIESIIRCDLYLPARRAAATVLTQLIAGIDNLNNFQEILLPVYRLLKELAENEHDSAIRTHANTGLSSLESKIKDFLTPKVPMEKEIQIFGLKDDDSKGTKKNKSILEII